MLIYINKLRFSLSHFLALLASLNFIYFSELFSENCTVIILGQALDLLV